ncbi:putative RNA-directed DNA polymerase from transposon X-element [Trichonephila inaurata madagascariensis]|uniref:Putative RNA-directed DNA polymerase from transposon X-element n=1 Tax=Trichonephila inaurata madagascariensis TaxID=2747483 RepID=A0A8X6WUQ0_9ARAC|nr:putative RNA-directed DNA polymerase from transposon X-element [Trichonephila inaurata madagascariensis]
MGDFNLKHRSWSPTGNSVGGIKLYNFTRNCGFCITAPTEPKRIPDRGNERPSNIDFSISSGLSNITAESMFDLSSDHNSVLFTFMPDFYFSYSHNCRTFTNWNMFQLILHSSIPGNPSINNHQDINSAITNLFRTNPCLHQPEQHHQAYQTPDYLHPSFHQIEDPRKKIILSEANSNPNAIHKITARNRKPIKIPPLLGHHGLVYSIQDKANLFMETLEESFKENPTPYDDNHIDLLDSEVRRYFRN